MSYFDYLACNRELPTGLYGIPPIAVYDSYLAYSNSVDFVLPRNPITHQLVNMNSEEQKELERLKGKVVVYTAYSDIHGVSLKPYEPIITRRGGEVFETGKNAMARHFTLPYLYNLDVSSGKMLVEFLCKYLQPGDQAEVYTCWAGEEEETYMGDVQIIDLEEVVRGRCQSDQLQLLNRNSFTRCLAPRIPHLENKIAPIIPIDHVMQIIKEDGSVGISVHKAHEQGFYG